MKEYYQIKKDINWRKENGLFFCLAPLSKKLLIFREDISAIISSKGQIETDQKSPIIATLQREHIIENIVKPKIALRYSSLNEFSAPFNVTIQITNICNLRCGHCHRGDFHQKKSLTLFEFKKIVRELRALNVFNVNISGGEPTLVPDLTKMVGFADQIGLKVTMSTNNTLMTDELAKELSLAGLREVHISLDSSFESKHNEIRGVRSAFHPMVENLALLRKNKIRYMFVTTLTDQSVEDYTAIFDLAFQLGASGHKTNTLVPEGRASLEAAKYYQDNKLFKKYARVWLAKKKEFRDRMSVLAETMFQIQLGKEYIAPNAAPAPLNIGCPAGILTCAIDENGNLSPCSFFGEVAGNVLSGSFSKVWNESSLLQKLRARPNSGHCKECSDKWSCSGCRARAFGTSKEIQSEDPYCYKNNHMELK